jgi:hypothetical protein
MRFATPILLSLSLTFVTAPPGSGQITSNPIPEPIVKRGLAVEVREIARLPDTRGMRPAAEDVSPAGRARINYVRELADGRRFVNDSRGFLYLLDANGQPSVYADVASAFPFAVYNRLSSGFIGFVFHPEFAHNGLFYTVHGERAPGNPGVPDFIPPGYTRADVTHHNVMSRSSSGPTTAFPRRSRPSRRSSCS